MDMSLKISLMKAKQKNISLPLVIIALVNFCTRDVMPKTKLEITMQLLMPIVFTQKELN